MDRRRRSSTGRSKILESSINLLSEFIKTKDLEDIYGLAINNSLPGEFRSTAWRIFLSILNKDDSGNWAKTTKVLRDNFYNLSKQLSENVLKYLRNELTEDQAKSLLDEKSLNIFNTVRNELIQISNNFDFFKSEIISEIVLRLIYVWSLSNTEFNDFSMIVSILAGIIYSLYPSILHIDISLLGINEENLENLEAQSLFYYLNTEEHFDADVYIIFNTIMTKGIKQFISNQIQYQPINSSEIDEILNIKDENLLLKRCSVLNKVDRILAFYLKIVSPEILTKLSSKKNEMYQSLETLISTILSKHLNSEYIIYFWDCIFINEIYSFMETKLHFDNDFFNFTDFILLAYLVLNHENVGKNDFHKLYLNSLQIFNGREVLKKAIKLREKVNNYYS
jgi:hypothetical protein